MSLPSSLVDIAFTALERFARDAHFGYRDETGWRTVSSAAVREQVRRLAGALAASGVGPGDRVAIVAPTRIEWALSDYATLSLGAVVVPVYPTLASAQLEYILEHSGACLALIGGRDEWARLAPVRAKLGKLREVVAMTPVEDGGAEAPLALERFLERSVPPPEARPKADDLASIIYTSGTTGQPKGVLLTHGNIVSNVLASTAVCPFAPSDVHMSFLPLSHIFERMVNYYMLWNGLTVYFAGDFGRLRENLLEVRPTILTSVPRVLEKVLAGIEEQGRKGGAVSAWVTRFAVETAIAWAGARHGDGRVPLGLDLRHWIADRLVYGKVRASLGGRVRSIITGGAATPEPLARFFLGAGMLVQPGYGLTESSPVIALNTPTDYRLGTVGKPLPGVEVRIAPDGEILARGPNVMRGYYDNEEATRQALTEDGWLLTGDVGELDADGFLRITDRKKDLIVTAGGKKVAPQSIELALVRDPLIAQAVLLGDGRPYISALVIPNHGALAAWARERGIQTTGKALLEDPRVLALYRERIDAASGELSRFETIKRFHLLENELSEAQGELTPTLKVKRRVVMERYRDEIESLYA